MPLKALFIIAVTTSRLIFPALPTLPGQEAIKGPQSGPAVKSLTMRLYAKTEIQEPEANVSLPPGLGLSETAGLKIYPYKLLPDQADSTSKITVKNYWGSSESIQSGQPNVESDSNKSAAKSFLEKDYNSLAAWPIAEKKSQEISIPEAASAVGSYKLTTNYTGETSVALGPEQDFLAPIALTDIGSKADLEKPVKLEWSAVPNALAYFVVAYGGNANETITWTAGSQAGAKINFDNTAFTREEIEKLIADKTLLPAETTTATIPAQIFKGSNSVMLIITAIGPDKIQDKDGIKTQVIVRSTASKPLFSSRQVK